jgi:hypothetical protein
LESEQMQGFWKRYQAEFDYSANITFEAAVGVAKEILSVMED